MIVPKKEESRMKWSLSNDCKNKFYVGQKVKTRGDMGGIELIITKIHNSHYCTCKTWMYGKKMHFNMNCLEPIRS
jgi:hypothetical protein